MTGRHPIGTEIQAARSRASFRTTVFVWTVSVIAVALVLLNQTDTSDLNGTVGNLAPALEVAVGAVLIIRLPRNRVGWLLWLGGVLIAISAGIGGFATYGLVTNPGSIPGATWLAWISAVSGLPGFAIAAGFLPLVYPTGRLLTPRWRAVVVVAVVATVLATIENAFGPFPQPSPTTRMGSSGVTSWSTREPRSRTRP